MPQQNIRDIKQVLGSPNLPYAVMKGNKKLVSPLELDEYYNLGVALYKPNGDPIYNFELGASEANIGAVKLVDENDLAYGVEHVDNKIRVSSMPYNYDISKGNISGHQSFSLEGFNPDVGTSIESIWDYGGVRTYLSSATALYISSSDNGDTQDYVVSGLDGNWDLQSVTQTATGQSQVRIGSTETWLRVFSIRNAGTTDNAGDVYVAESDSLTGGVPDTASKVQAKMQAGHNQSHNGLYTIPNGYIAYLNLGYVANSSLKATNIYVGVRYFGGVFLRTRPTSIYATPFLLETPLPTALPAKTDIEYRASSSVAGAVVSAGMLGWIETV